jgi:hypothetical protein
MGNAHLSEQTNNKAAKTRARQLGRFYPHVLTSVGTITFLGIVNLLTSDSLWIQWPALGIGASVVIHAWRTFGAESLFGKEWEERKTAELTGEKAKRKNEEPLFEESPTD